MAVKQIVLPDVITQAGNTAFIRDDFFSLTDTQLWTVLQADSGATVARAAGVNGLVLTTGAVDNNEAYIESTDAFVDVAAGRPFVVGAIFQYAEANTDDANVIFGVGDAAMANLLQDNGAGPAATYDGFMWFKEDGQTLWSVERSVAGTQTTIRTNVTAGGASRTHLKIQVTPNADGTTAEVVWLSSAQGPLNLTQPAEDGSNPRVPQIKETVTIADYSAMNIQFGAKAGSANSEVVNLDCLYFAQARAS